MCHSEDLTCLISKSIETNKSGLFSYPIELYGWESGANLKLNEIDPSSLYDCSVKRVDGHEISNVHCMNPTPNEHVKCPILPQFIDIFTKSTKPTGNEDALCNLLRRIKELDTSNGQINIVAFGGSVTEGKHTNGCCCTDQARCPAFHETCKQRHGEINNTTGFSAKDNQARFQVYIRYCSWVRYVFDFITATFPKANIHTINLGVDAYTSERMYNQLDSKMAIAGIKAFSSSDLILLDHSMNDFR